jgi:hypothetical protein
LLVEPVAQERLAVQVALVVVAAAADRSHAAQLDQVVRAVRVALVVVAAVLAVALAGLPSLYSTAARACLW